MYSKYLFQRNTHALQDYKQYKYLPTRTLKYCKLKKRMAQYKPFTDQFSYTIPPENIKNLLSLAFRGVQNSNIGQERVNNPFLNE